MTQYSNGKLGAEFINPAIMDWLTLSIQDTGLTSYISFATTIPYWNSTAVGTDSANVRYIMTRRPISALTSSTAGNDTVSGTTTSLTEATVISPFTACFDETMFNTLNLNGKVRGIIKVGLTSSTTVAAYLSNVTISLYKANTTGRTLLGSFTNNVAASNATTTEVIYSVPYMFSIAGNTVVPGDALYISVTTTGYVASAATCTHKIYLTRGTSESYVEIQI